MKFGAAILAMLVALSFVGCSQSPQAKSAKYMGQGKKLLEQKNPTSAILQFRNAAKLTPKDPDVYYQLALAYLALNDAKSAVDSLQLALEVDPKHTEARLKLGQLMSMVDDPEILKQAQERLQGLVDDTGGDPNALHALALTELKLGEKTDAMQLLSKALATAPQNVMIAVTDAQIKLQQNNPKGAEEVLKKMSAASDSADAHTVLGEFYVSQNRLEEAQQEFERALKLDPDHEPALASLASLQNQVGKKQEAEASYKRLSAFRGKTHKADYATFLFQEGRHDEAIREFEKLAKADPEDRLARTRLIAAYQESNRPMDAEKVVSDTLKKNPKDLDALLQRGEISLSKGNYDAAEADFNAVSALDANSAEVHYVLAKLRAARGNHLGYRQELYEALKNNPNALQIRLDLARAVLVEDPKNGAAATLSVLDAAPPSQKDLLPVIVERNWVLLSQKNFAELRKGVDRGLARGKTSDLLLQDAVSKLQAGKLGPAQASLEAALEIDGGNLGALDLLRQSYGKDKTGGLNRIEEFARRQPKSAPIQVFLGTVRLASGDRAGARTAFLAAKAADPKYLKADQSLVQMDMAERKWNDATARLKTMIAANPNDSTAQLWLGDVELLNGNLEGALGGYRKVVENDSLNTRALNNLAFVLAVYSKKPDEALKYAQKAVELAPRDSDSADTLGWVLYQKGLYDQAVPPLERAASQKGNPAWRYHLAMAYAKAGKASRAQTVLRAALKDSPNAPEATEAINVVGQVR